jgi:NAD(P)-dependent dehydrogenase (short-subunit alcohol dehydrogenase family)
MRILITGAARAIGAATAAELTARGHEVVATARSPESLARVAAAKKLALDVRDVASIKAALEQAGEIDAVVNNAALSGSGPLEDFPIDRAAEIFDTNCLGALRMIQAVTPAWRGRGSGIIVNISSVQGRVATPLAGCYAASKYALEAISETLHYELGHFGIRVVIVEPGYTSPGMQPSEPHQGPAAYHELWEQWSGADDALTGPGGRIGADVVARAVGDAIEDPATPLRVPVGEDAALVFSARRRLDDANFEAAMRARLHISW